MIFNNMLMWGASGVTTTVTVTIVGRNVVKEYNGSNQSISGYTVTSISNPEYTVSDFTFSGSASATGNNKGTYSMGLVASQFTNNNSKFKDVRFVVTDGYIKINPKNVTVAAVAKSKTYDGNSGTDPALTATVTGLVGSDTISYILTRVTGQNAGQYTITPSGNAEQGNYVVNYSTAKFTINPAPVTLTANSGTKTYNGSNQSVTGFTCNISGRTFTGVSASATGKNAGNYNVVFSGVTLNTTRDSTGNYVVTRTVNGVLTINRKAVTVKADNKSKTYGSSDPALTATVTGLVGSDTVSYTLSRASGNNVGTYTITASGNATQGNYSVTYQNGTFTINRKAVTVKADNKSKTYGSSDPALTATVTGLVGSDTVSYSLSRASGNNVGTYTITPTGNATQGNYSVTYQAGTFTINKAAASALGLRVTSYSGARDGLAHSITATVTVTSGTTLYYRTSTTGTWSTTKPTRTAVGTTTVYVEARNGNYNTASATGTITIVANKLYVFKEGNGMQWDYEAQNSVTVTSNYISFDDDADTGGNPVGEVYCTGSIDLSGYTKMYVEIRKSNYSSECYLRVLPDTTSPIGMIEINGLAYDRAIYSSTFDPNELTYSGYGIPYMSGDRGYWHSSDYITIYNWWFE